MSITETMGENFIHPILWEIAVNQLNEGESVEAGSSLKGLTAMIFTMHAFEAYLNFIGDRLHQEIWKDERNFFSPSIKNGYNGVLGKFSFIYKSLGLAYDENCPPYKSLFELKRLRDLIAHGKVEPLSFESHHHSQELPPMPSLILDKTKINDARLTSLDVLKIAKLIHVNAKPKVLEKGGLKAIWFGNDPFEMVTQYGSRSTTSSV